MHLIIAVVCLHIMHAKAKLTGTSMTLLNAPLTVCKCDAHKEWRQEVARAKDAARENGNLFACGRDGAVDELCTISAHIPAQS